MKIFLAFLFSLIASVAQAQVVHDYNPPALGTSTTVQRNDLNAEYDGINTDKQNVDAELTCITALTSAADKIAYYTGSGTCALADFSAAIRTLITTPSSANLRAMLSDELGTGVLFFLGAPASDDQVFVSTSVSAGAWGTLPDSDAATQKLQYDQTTNAFSAGTDDDIPDSVGDLAFIDTSAELNTLITDNTGSSGALVFANDPALTGNPTTPTAAQGDNDTSIASTAFVKTKTESFCVAASDETTTIAATPDKVHWRMPYAFTILSIRGSLTGPSTSGTFTGDVHENGTTIMATNKLVFDANEETTTTAATLPTVSDTALADDAEMSIDVDNAGTSAEGFKVCLIGHQ